MSSQSASDAFLNPIALRDRLSDLEATLARQADELQTLRARLHSLERAQAEAGLAVWAFDVPSGTGWWSAHMYTLFGCDPVEGVPSIAAYLELIHPEDRALIAQTMADLTEGRPPELRDFRTNPAHGPLRILRPHYHVEYDTAGRPARFVGTNLDVTSHRQDQARLREQEERYRLLFETMAQGVVYQAADGSIIDANPAAQHILGLTLDQLQGRTPFDPRWRAVRPDGSDFPGEQHPAMVALRSGQPVLGAVMGVNDARSQRRRWISVNAIPLMRPGEAIPYQVYATFADITARIEAEEQLRKSEAQYRHLFEHNPHPMWVFDETSLRFLAVNDAAVQAYGYSRDEFLGMTIQDIRPPEERVRLAQHMARTRPALSSAGLWRHQRKDGSVIDVEITTHAIELFGQRARLVVAQDITAQLQAEAALRQSEARFATIFTHSPVALVLTRLRDGVIIDANPAFEALFGYSRAVLLGHTTLELGLWVHVEDRQYVIDQLQIQQHMSSFEAVVRTAAGAKHYVLLSGELVRIDGEPHRLVQALDITVRKAAQQALEELNQTLELRVQQRTAEVQGLYQSLRQANAELARAAHTKDAFLANMSHELRTPINAILGYSESLQEQIYGPLSKDQLGAIGHIDAGGRHLLSLINDILDLSKVEAGRLELQIEPVTVAEVCQTSMLFVREQAIKKRLRLGMELSDPNALIAVDLKRLKQMLVNLLSNAVKYTPPGGDVSLTVTLDAEAGVAQFVVSDTGIGIAPEDVGRLFQPFVQLDSALNRTQTGTGLGLALVRRLAEAHGGSVTVESVPDEGSRFTIALPLRQLPAELEADLALGAAAAQPALAAAPASGRILLVDDSADNLNVIRSYLHARGYEVVVAGDGYEALAMADATRPDVILMDIQMPMMDGLEAIRRLRSQPAHATTPIIALTALTMPGDKERCLAAGATDYLAKPVSLRVLTQAVQRLLGG